MPDAPKISNCNKILTPFLDSNQTPDGTMTYHELQGYLFSIACSPELIKPSEWLPIIFNEQQVEYDTNDQAQSVLQALMELYNDMNDQVFNSRVCLPCDIEIKLPAIKNIGDNTCLGQWSKGFLQGHQWLIELWESYTPREMDEELNAKLVVLTFFSHQDLAQNYYRDFAQASGQTLDDLATTMYDLLPDALTSYAHLANSIQTVIYERNQIPYTNDKKIGRNEACPCGSGKKYKKCCLH